MADVRPGEPLLLLRRDEVEEHVVERGVAELEELGGGHVEAVADDAQAADEDVGRHLGPLRHIVVPAPDLRVL